jgi:hypothetical protein
MEGSQEATESLKRGTKKTKISPKDPVRPGDGGKKQWPVGDNNLANFSNRL